VSTMEATKPTMKAAVSSSTKITPTTAPGPVPLGASDPSNPTATTQATALITVAQIQPRRLCSSRTAAATTGSGSVAEESGAFTRVRVDRIGRMSRVVQPTVSTIFPGT
jgi:hypothetical protein